MRLFALVIVLAVSHTTWAADDAKVSGRIVVDASKDGGVWWFPQGEDSFDPAKHHQGKWLADDLRSRGWEVEEIASGDDVTARLEGADIVIRANFYGEYKPSEVLAYREYVAAGGNVLLLRGFVREGQENRDQVAAAFGIVFSKTVRTATIRRWTQHPLAKDLDLLPYQIGSVVTKAPKSKVPIAYLDQNQLVMGTVTIGKGKVVFVSTILPLLKVPQPFMSRTIEELIRRDEHRNRPNNQ